MSRFVIQLEKVLPGCSLSPGLSVQPSAGPVVIGRDADVDVQLPDPSISGRHVKLSPLSAGGFEVENLSQRGGTFIDHQRLEVGQRVCIPKTRTWIQLGRALIKVTLTEPTVPIDIIMSLPTGTTAKDDALLKIRRSPMLRIWLGSQLAPFYPAAARVLACLADAEGGVVLQETLLEAIDPEFHLKAGGANLTQNITYVRNAFDQALDKGWLDQDRLTELVQAVQPERPLPRGDRRALLRALVANERGVGYRLNLPPSALDTESAP